ncbi:hypothetical protein EBH_0037670 [Eimeria brunetti]|uniref:Uncharacterized protein n=1 Tax=Eimeria brunetti TaxID=51314 RepID=U6LLB5_9EIME|nr:hypothetical protein EBH_0037670 [Eimeria brunetti]
MEATRTCHQPSAEEWESVAAPVQSEEAVPEMGSSSKGKLSSQNKVMSKTRAEAYISGGGRSVYERFSGDSLVGPLPYDVVFGLDWLTEQKLKGGSRMNVPQKDPCSEQAYDLLAKQLAGMAWAQTAALLCPTPKGYECQTREEKKVPVVALLEQAIANVRALSDALQGPYIMLHLPETGMTVVLRFSDESEREL